MRRFNFNQFIWFIILLSLFLTIGFLFITGKIFLLVSEKMKIYIILTIVFLFIMLIVQFPRIFTIPSRGGIKKGYFFFFIFISAMVLVLNIDILKSSLLMKGVTIEHRSHSHGSGHNHSLVMKEDSIIVEKDNFHKSIEAINESLDSYIGKEIIIEGLLYNETVEVGDFIITEIDMNCCMVDSSFIGITCTGENYENFKTGDYVKAKGILKYVEHNGKNIPTIEIEGVEKSNR